MMDAMSGLLLGKHPNTYTFTKALAEALLFNGRRKGPNRHRSAFHCDRVLEGALSGKTTCIIIRAMERPATKNPQSQK
ncbi:hypothetical protein HPB48_022133 [Haemaphysalis longicornis]|uniref:Uncharacterized protein n=1 Tax=Haemaphysalis longicornis TaxID=44386 RepID=A0A9J6G658_HAELO|nr:hypothetical protein HPB48_022133 [Haemaphysalis longicornis]